MKRYPWHLALVTGAASGIGREFCLRLAESGCDLAMVDIASMDDTRRALPKGIKAYELNIDLTHPHATAEIVAWLDKNGLNPDLLVNNAGIFDFASVEALSPGRIDLYINLHIGAVTHLTREMAIRMAGSGGGFILNMSSMSCWMPMPGIAMYAATKAYIRVFSRALRVEMKDAGVSVTVACPGGIATDLFGLPRNLQKLGVKVGALATVRGFVEKALDRTARKRKQYVNGVINRIAIIAVSSLPESARGLIKTRILQRYGKS